MSDLKLSVSCSINAPIESVFNAWLNADMLAKFMIPGDGMTVPKAEANAVIGGRFDIIMQAGDKELPHGGQYLEIVPFTRIVFTWEAPFSVDGSVVTLEMSTEGNGTLIKLVHVKFPDDESRANHEGGWSTILTHLEQAIAA